jgi:hypothetical protein
VLRQRADEEGLGLVELRLVGGVPVDAVRPEVGPGDLARVVEQRRRPARLLLRGVEEVGPGGELPLDLRGVVAEAGRAPVLADEYVFPLSHGWSRNCGSTLARLGSAAWLSFSSRPFSAICGMNEPVGTTMSYPPVPFEATSFAIISSFEA